MENGIAREIYHVEQGATELKRLLRGMWLYVACIDGSPACPIRAVTLY